MKSITISKIKQPNDYVIIRLSIGCLIKQLRIRMTTKHFFARWYHNSPSSLFRIYL